MSDFVQMQSKCGDGAFCGSFKECSDCSHNVCPVGIQFGHCAVIELPTVVFYASFYRYADLDFEVCTVDSID